MSLTLLTLALLQLLTSVAAAAASASVSVSVSASGSVVGWPDSLEKSVRDLRAEIQARLVEDKSARERLHQQHPWMRKQVASSSSGQRLVVENRAGTHLFLMKNGFAVDAQLGVNRVYHVREGFLFREVCACGVRTCARHYKPAFYCLVVSVCLVGVALLATLWAGIAAAVRRRRAVATEGAAAWASAHRPLLSGSAATLIHFGDSNGLSIKCDPVICDGRFAQNVEKATV